MNTQIAVHPRLHHYGLTTAKLDAMVDWYREALGMTVVHRSEVPPQARGRAPFSALAFISNDEYHHRIVLFETPGIVDDPDRGRHARLQHVAFVCNNHDDLLGAYVRLKGKGIAPVWAADHGVALSIYYLDPDQNRVELTANNYSDEWTATEHMRVSPAFMAAPFDPDKMLAARKAGASPWELHERAVAGEFARSTPPDPRAFF